MGGLATGLDTQQMIQDLMRAHRQPVDRLKQQRQVLEWQREDYRAVNSTLLNFRNKVVFPMRLESTFQAKTAASSDTTVVTATAPAAAAQATYEVTVNSLATTAFKASTADISANSADKIDPDANLWSQRDKFSSAWTMTETFDFTVTTYNQDGSTNTQIFTVDATTESLNNVLNRISADPTLGLTAFHDGGADRVSISTTRTGNNNLAGDEIEIGTTGFLAEALHLGTAAEQGGTNATATINGLAIERATNEFTLNQVNFDLQKIGTATVTVQVDTETVLQNITNFVTKYNKLLDNLNARLQETRHRDYFPLLTDDPRLEHLTDRQVDQWQEKARSGLLRGDTILSSAGDRMRSEIFTPVDGLDPAWDHLTDIGINVGTFEDRGKLVIDEAKLRQAIEQNPNGVAALFNQTGATSAEQGLARRLDSILDATIQRLTARAGSPTGLQYDPSFVGRSIQGIDERIERLEGRLVKLEDRYWKQFAVMEEAIARMNAQSIWLAQQMGGAAQ
jgi:flagellar hook-associated protein 2